MSIHKIALVGAGRMGTLHARTAAKSPRFQLAAIADHNERLAMDLAEEVGASLQQFDQILADPDIEAVLVASSTSSHLENVIAAVKAGKAVFCEKPLSLNAGTLATSLPDIERSSKPVFIAFNRRFDPHLRELKRQLDEGRVGELETIHIINHDPAAPRLDFIPRSGGLFKDFTIHDFDTARWISVDDVIEVFATGSCLIDPEIEKLGDIDTAKLVLRTARGILCVISNSRRTGYGYDQRVELFGSKGALRVDNIHLQKVSQLAEAGESSAPFPFSFVERYADAYEAELDHFADVLEGRSAPATGPRDSLSALRLADAAELSVQNRGPVQLPTGEVN